MANRVGRWAWMFALLLTGCPTTPYQKDSMWNGVRGGYRDKQVAPGVYELRFTATSYTSTEQLIAHWRRRAAELCAPRGYSAQPAYKNEMQMANMINGIPIMMSQPVVSGTVHCEDSAAE